MTIGGVCAGVVDGVADCVVAQLGSDAAGAVIVCGFNASPSPARLILIAATPKKSAIVVTPSN
jgi:hypothetical protein